MLGFVFDIILQPLIFFYDIIFSFSHRIIQKLFYIPSYEFVIAIFFVSIAVNILSLPLYKRADEIQNEENEIQKKLLPISSHIKKTFNGDERFMMQSALYKIKNYKPYYALRGSLSLLLQIPFFTAAYMFFNSKTVMRFKSAIDLSSIFGENFYLIKDLSLPDGILNGINFLPILMTIVNIITAIIYTEKFDLKGKIQPIVLAMIFLVILYDSPSCLVLYWLFNNILSLVKTIVFKFIHEKNNIPKDSINVKNNNKVPYLTFLCLTIAFSCFLALYIPSSIIKASPLEFCVFNRTPNDILKDTSMIFFGVGFWIMVYFTFLNEKSRVILHNILCFVTIISIINFLFFGTKFGMITADFVYANKEFVFSDKENILNILTIILVIILVFILCKFKVSIFSYIICITIICFSIFNIYNINTQLKEKMVVKTENQNINFSKNGKNVIVLILDMAKGAYMPYILNTFPEIKESFDGFTYYPNTMSFGGMTIFGLPSILGGYDYIPYEINKRENELVTNKFQEASKVLPEIFYNNGYDINIVDSDFYSVLSSYGDKYNIINTNIDYDINSTEYLNYIYVSKIRTNFFVFMKCLPTFFQKILYHRGNYFITIFNSSFNGDVAFPEQFNKLKKIVDSTFFDNKQKNCFSVMYNATPHLDAYLSYPNYDTSIDNEIIADDKIEYYDDKGRKFNPYSDSYCAGYKSLDSNIATFMQVKNWLNKLKQLNIYDNSRIIIVSDHGYVGDEFEYLRYKKTDGDMEAIIDIEAFNSVLFYKDFNQKGEMKISNEFMTQADTPTLATNDLIEEPKNPSLNTPISSEYKYKDKLYIVPNWSYGFDTDIEIAKKSKLKIGNEATQYLPRMIQSSGDLRDPHTTEQLHYCTYTIKGNSDIFDPNNWEIDFEPIRKYNKNFNDKEVQFERYIEGK